MKIWLLLFQLTLVLAQEECSFCKGVDLRGVNLQIHCCGNTMGRGLLQQKGVEFSRVQIVGETPLNGVGVGVVEQQITHSQSWWLGNGHQISQFLIIVNSQENFDSVRQQAGSILDSKGLILGHIQSEVIIVLTDKITAGRIESEIESVLAITEYKPEYKIAPELTQILLQDQVNEEMQDNFEGLSEGYLMLQIYLIETDEMELLDYEQMESILRVQIVETCQEKCQWGRYGIHHVWVKVPLSNLQNLVLDLIELQFIHWVDVEERARVYNFFANSIVQVGQIGLAEAKRPFWDVGVNGLGQVVGVGDTGLDYDSCFFRDPNATAPNMDHRKVVDYRIMGDALDGSGHGTHVCGTILGQVEDGKAKNHNGIAPGSRIAFTDLGQGEDKYLKLPQEGMEQYYSWSYARGARTHSDSWGGGPSGGYKYTSRDADKFMWDNMDFIAVLAAGNEGETYSRETTINSLAACKNAIAVGSTLGPFGASDTDIEGMPILFEVSSPEDTNDIIKVVQAEFGPGFEGLSADPLGYIVETTVPEEGCVEGGVILKSDTVGSSLVGKIALIKRGGCNYLDKVLGAQYAGAVAVFVYSTVENEYGYSSMAIPKTMAAEGEKIQIPSAHMAFHVSQQVLRIKQRGELSLKLSPQQIVPANVPRFDNIASFSSFGPTDDNRIKPDIVAPGEAIRSAYGDRNLSSQNCQTAQLTGTSMSTPVIAGAILLIRQYFEDGFYPAGVANPAAAFVPSSALVKATLLNGAVDLQGVAETGLPLEPAPSVRQGWGRVNLHTTLALPDSKFTLWAEQNNYLTSNVNHKYCVKIPVAPQPDEYVALSVTLVWTDYPAELQAVNQTLVNDLDLKVISPPGLPRSTRGPAPDPDRKNNVEKEIVRLPVGGASYMILVTGFDVKEIKPEVGGQPYALVVTAPKGSVIEQCEDCLECPSGRPLNGSALQAPVPIEFEPPGETSQAEFDDPCTCSDTGVDLGTGVDSGYKGCHQHGLAEGEKQRTCYVVDSVGCGDGAFPSVLPGVAWRTCGFFEEMISSITIWQDPKPGTTPQFIQNETTTIIIEDSTSKSQEPLLVAQEDKAVVDNDTVTNTPVVNTAQPLTAATPQFTTVIDQPQIQAFATPQVSVVVPPDTVTPSVQTNALVSPPPTTTIINPVSP